MDAGGEGPADGGTGPTPSLDAPSSPSLERRLALEAAGLDAVGTAADTVVSAYREAGAHLADGDGWAAVRDVADALLRAGLAELVQGGLEVDHAARVRGLIDAVRGHVDLDEVLRITRTVGVDHVVEHIVGRGLPCTRAEDARLRDATSRVIASVTGTHVGTEADERQILRRLLSTGADLR